MWYIVVFQPFKCRNTNSQPQIWSIWPIFPNDSESLPKVCYIKRKNSEILSKLRNSEPVGASARLIPSHWHSSRSSDQPALSILVCTSLYCHHHRQGRSLCQNMWTMSLSKNASTHFSAQISCKGPILLFRMISVKPTWPRGQFGGTLYSIEIKGS